MRMIFALVLAIGVALAGAAVYLAQNYIGQTQTALAKERELRAKTGPMVEVLVLTTDKAYGDKLTEKDVQVVYMQENALPEGIFHDLETLFPEDAKDKPRFVSREMQKFEPILASKVTEPGQAAGLNGSLEAGMRAFAIKVEAADFLQPGDHVDLYWTGADTTSGGDITRLILTNVEVIAVNRSEDEGLSNGVIQSRTITVAADPSEVGILAQATATGRLVMSLVGMGDLTQTAAVEVDSNALLGVTEAAPAPQAAPDRVCSIKTRKGDQVIETPIPCTN